MLRATTMPCGCVVYTAHTWRSYYCPSCHVYMTNEPTPPIKRKKRK